MQHLAVSQNGSITEVKNLLEEGLHKQALQSIPKIVQSMTTMSTEQCHYPIISDTDCGRRRIICYIRFYFTLNLGHVPLPCKYSRKNTRWRGQREKDRLDEIW